MAITYSFKKSDVTYGSDLVLISRPITDEGGRTTFNQLNTSIDTIAEYIGTPTPPDPLTYGLYAQLTNSEPITNTTEEMSLIGEGVGTLSVPPDGFVKGDSFRAIFGGEIDCANNQDFRVRAYINSEIVLDSGLQTVSNLTGNIFTMNIDFTIRELGAPGISSIVALGTFHYTKQSNGNVEGFAFNTVNNTTFDTNVANTLDVKFQWANASGSNRIYSDLFVLNKTF